MPYIILPRLLRKYRVLLSEKRNDECMQEIAFECEAEDMLHAMEKASDAFPGCQLNWTASHLLDEQEGFAK